MLNSRNIDDLRPDVAANVRVWLELCRQAGLNPLVTGTVRDQAFQDDCIRRGTAPKGSKPTFHAVGVGLAFDFCKNVKGHEYSDLSFFLKCADIAKTMGFEWGGDWKSFPDRPHLQWSGPGHSFNSSDILAGRRPPDMPLYTVAQTRTDWQRIIQCKCRFSNPEDIWSLLDTHRFADDLYRKWAGSYG